MNTSHKILGDFADGVLLTQKLNSLWSQLQPEEKLVPIRHIPIIRGTPTRIGSSEGSALIRPVYQIRRGLNLVI
jgi:hypothetical protein